MTLETTTIEETDSITRIYACATVWHETQEELLSLLESILRLDQDQRTRQIARRHLHIVDPDYYELETHIFLDDAFEVGSGHDHVGCSRAVNQFVRRFVAVVGEAVSRVHKMSVAMRLPTKVVTPYGGRIEWTLPGKTKMLLHLKDRTKIRIKKRWSQVMYMHFLLGHCLADLPIAEERKKTRAENTYLLTLDGDVSFQPRAVLELVDLMKHNTNLGAACGRLHPLGNGPMVWYQIFEYAISHWLQKTTENLVGCVLCSPGCFSLYRATAVMNENVICKYTAKPQKAKHYVQYDQGEDRWLSTLLLQAGYRVEYADASDAYTHCPESFSEFFNQRRRWIPSTAANLLDSLLNSERMIKTNESITHFYILYQFIMMIFSILVTGTTFLMLVEVFVNVLDIDKWTSLYFNIALTAFFVLVCFTCKPEKQLLLAQVMSILYALFSIASFTDTILRICDQGARSAILFVLTWSAVAIAALLHPQEIGCIVFAVVFTILIPTTYFLMNLYSVINLNNISWGTREVQTEDVKPTKLKPRKQTEGEAKHHAVDAHHEFITEFPDAQIVYDDWNKDHLTPKLESSTNNNEKNGSSKNFAGSTIDIHDHIIPSWIEDKDLQEGPVALLESQENEFWIELIKRYLYPLKEDEREKARIASSLKYLRNQVAFVFLIINVIFVAIVFLLQVHKVQLQLEWPFGMVPQVDTPHKYLQLEPVGLIYVLSLTIQIIQFVGMIVNRCNTVRYFFTSSRLTNFSRRKWSSVNNSTIQQQHLIDEVKNKRMVNSIRNLQWMEGLNNKDEICYEKSSNLVAGLGKISSSPRTSKRSLGKLYQRNKSL